jgi:NADP-dependent 3-hydroxy acid dehydrogenase YdfG
VGEVMVTGAAGRCIQPETLAATVAWVLAAPADAYVSELSVLAAPHGN